MNKENHYEYKSLHAYDMAYRMAMEVFELSKTFPTDEDAALTGCLRRSSRLICSNIAAAFAKPGAVENYSTLLADADSKCAETIVWLDFSCDCQYLSSHTFNRLRQAYEEIGKMLGNLALHPDLLPV